jgi:hypothetical protein
MRFNPVDLRTAAPPVGDAPGHGVMDIVLDLHKDMLLGKAGEYFLGAMGLCLVLALVSGVVLYAPFARKPGFATVRRGNPTAALARLAQRDRRGDTGRAMVVGCDRHDQHPGRSDHRAGGVPDLAQCTPIGATIIRASSRVVGALPSGHRRLAGQPRARSRQCPAPRSPDRRAGHEIIGASCHT